MNRKQNNEPTLNKAKAEINNEQNSEQDFSVEFGEEFRTTDPNGNNKSRNKKNNRKNDSVEFSEEFDNDKVSSFPENKNTRPDDIDYKVLHKKDHEFKPEQNFYTKKPNNKENKLF